MIDQKYYLTSGRLEELKKELNELKTTRRIQVADRLKKAKELGDLSENSEYVEAREEQALVESRIFELEDMTKNAAVIVKEGNGKNVQIGSTVIAEKDGQRLNFVIVGSNESKPEAGFISNESPLGRAFLNKKAGDKVAVVTPRGEVVYKVISVE